MSLFSKLFGGGTKSGTKVASENYQDFTITPMPMKEAQGFRVCAQITKTIDGVEKIHRLVRADTINNIDEATKASVGKAKQMIDEQGDRLFD